MAAKTDQTQASFLRVDDLTVKVPVDDQELSLLENVSFEIQRGEKVCILGISGCGKSTLLEFLGLLVTPPKRTIFLEGVDLGTVSNSKRTAVRRHRFGFVFQNFNLIDHYTALENVALPLRYAGVRSKSAKDLAFRQLELLDMHTKSSTVASKLSGGERQRVAIARATVNNPDIVFADEPTGSLDVTTGEKVLDTLLARGAQDGRSLVMVTHNPDYAARFDRCLTLNAGRLV